MDPLLGKKLVSNYGAIGVIWVVPISIWAIGVGVILSSLPAAASNDDSWIPVEGGPNSSRDSGTR